MRETILSEIRRLAGENDGSPPGRNVFERATGISRYQWQGVFWAKWSEAVTEAGFTPNEKNVGFDEHHLLTKLAEAVRHYQRLPTTIELKMYKTVDPEFPARTTFSGKLGGQRAMASRLRAWAGEHKSFQDVLDLLPESAPAAEEEPAAAIAEGYVYLLASGAHYKIGRTGSLERRIREIGIALPEAVDLVHAIRTDDPAGIEDYWHRRFASKRANGEWFKLSARDVAAFRRRKFQ